MKNVWLLFPCSPLDGLKKVDEDFSKEHEAAIKAGFKIFLFDHDKLVKTGEVQFNELPKNAVVILRGWMLSMEQYTLLHTACSENGTSMLTDPFNYESKHYWPCAYERYPFLRSISPRCFWTYSTAFSVRHIKQFFGGAPIIVKDHVKSAKGAKDAMFIKDSSDKHEVWAVIENMIRERGPLFQRGIVLKEMLKVKRDADGNPIEFRSFFYGKKALSTDPNGCKWIPSDRLYGLASSVAGQLGDGFYTVDFILCEDDTWKVLECGDGQVSGLASSANPMLFYERLRYEVYKLGPDELNEQPLEDDFPVHWDYLYVVDGKVVRSDIKGTVAELKADLKKRGISAEEVTSCDIFGRKKLQETN